MRLVQVASLATGLYAGQAWAGGVVAGEIGNLAVACLGFQSMEVTFEFSTTTLLGELEYGSCTMETMPSDEEEQGLSPGNNFSIEVDDIFSCGGVSSVNADGNLDVTLPISLWSSASATERLFVLEHNFNATCTFEMVYDITVDFGVDDITEDNLGGVEGNFTASDVFEFKSTANDYSSDATAPVLAGENVYFSINGSDLDVLSVKSLPKKCVVSDGAQNYTIFDFESMGACGNDLLDFTMYQEAHNVWHISFLAFTFSRHDVNPTYTFSCEMQVCKFNDKASICTGYYELCAYDDCVSNCNSNTPEKNIKNVSGDVVEMCNLNDCTDMYINGCSAACSYPDDPILAFVDCALMELANMC